MRSVDDVHVCFRSKPMANEVEEIDDCPMPIPEERRNWCAREHAILEGQAEAIEAKLKSDTATTKARVKEIRDRSSRLRSAATTGIELQTRLCIAIPYYEDGTIEWVVEGTQHDEHPVIGRTDPLDPETQQKERQRQIDFSKGEERSEAERQGSVDAVVAMNGGVVPDGFDAEGNELPKAPIAACEGCMVVVTAVSNHRGDCPIAHPDAKGELCGACNHTATHDAYAQGIDTWCSHDDCDCKQFVAADRPAVAPPSDDHDGAEDHDEGTDDEADDDGPDYTEAAKVAEVQTLVPTKPKRTSRSKAAAS